MFNSNNWKTFIDSNFVNIYKKSFKCMKLDVFCYQCEKYNNYCLFIRCIGVWCCGRCHNIILYLFTTTPVDTPIEKTMNSTYGHFNLNRVGNTNNKFFEKKKMHYFKRLENKLQTLHMRTVVLYVI